MKTLLTGARGQLGYELRRTLAPLGPVIACDRTELQVADPVSIRHVVRDTAPALIVNAGAYTAVDPAESEPDLAMAINGIAPGILAEEAKRIGAATVHYSTDYVFDGEKNGPYVEDDPAQSAQCLRMHQARRRAGRDRCRRALPHIQDQLDLWLARPQFHAHDPAPRAAG